MWHSETAWCWGKDHTFGNKETQIQPQVLDNCLQVLSYFQPQLPHLIKNKQYK